MAHILVVDDDSFTRALLGTRLTAEGYQVSFAASGAEALRLAREILPDLVLLDVMMPGMDGFETCGQLRADPVLAEIPIIFITALEQDFSRLQGLQRGADDYVTKPVNFQELSLRVHNITTLNRYRKLLEERSRFDWIVEHIDEGYVLLGPDGMPAYANAVARGYLQIRDGEDLRTIPFLTRAARYFQCEPACNWRDWPEKAVSPCYLVRAEGPANPALWLQVERFQPPRHASADWLLCLRDVTEKVERYQRIWCFQELVTHKLSTPLNALNAVDMLDKAAHDFLDDDGRELLDVVVEGARQLRSQINRIVEYINMPVAAPANEGFCLSELSELAADLRRQFGIALRLELAGDLQERQVNLSRAAMTMILMELLNNAQKFHPRRQARVEISVASEHPGQAVLRVTDDGIHLPVEMLDKLWTPYFQYEKSVTGEQPGMGLGLPAIAAMLWWVGGSCRLFNRPDKPGMIVELSVPLMTQPPQEQGEDGIIWL